MSNVSTTSELVFPRLEPAEVRVFLAEDSTGKREDIVASLAAVGLAHSVTIATNYVEAEEFIRAQEPGSLQANVYLLDGNLDPESDNTSQGWHLARTLLDKYTAPIMAIRESAERDLKALSLSGKAVAKLLGGSPTVVTEVGLARLHSEAFLTSVSLESKNSIDPIGQRPWTPYKEVGQTVFDAVIPRTVSLAEAPSFGKTILQFDPDSRAARAYRQLAEEVIRITS